MFQEISRGAGYRFHNTSLVLVEHGYNPQICFSNLLQGLLCFKILLLCKRILCLLTFNLGSDSSALNDIHNLVLRDIWLRRCQDIFLFSFFFSVWKDYSILSASHNDDQQQKQLQCTHCLHPFTKANQTMHLQAALSLEDSAQNKLKSKRSYFSLPFGCLFFEGFKL